MRTIMMFLLSNMFLSFAIFANPFRVDFSGNNFSGYQRPTVQFDDSFEMSDTAEPPSASEVSSSAGRIFGIGFLFVVSFISGIVLLVLCLLMFFRWKKIGSVPKLLLSGCSFVFLIVFILSMIGAVLALYYSVKENNSSGTETSNENEKYSAEVQNDQHGTRPEANIKQDEAEVAKFAFSKFNNALKLYQEYQRNYDPDIYKKAIEEIELAIANDSENPAYWFLAGKIYSEIAPDYTAQIVAEDYLRKAYQLDPKNLQIILTLANCLSLQERYYEANELFKKALSSDYYALRDYLVPIITYTYIYDYQTERAEKFLRGLLESDPGADVIRICLAITLNMQDPTKSEDAKNELRKIIAKDSPPLLKTYASNLLRNFDKWHDRRFEE